MRFYPFVLLPVTALVLGACGGGSGSSANGPTGPTSPNPPSTPSGPAETNQVEVRNNVFTPTNIKVPVNTSVRWTWSSDATAHNVTLPDGSGSGDKTASDVFTKVFAAAGTFNYQCTIHGGMAGSVLVSP